MVNKIMSFRKKAQKKCSWLVITLTARVQLLNSYISAGETDFNYDQKQPISFRESPGPRNKRFPLALMLYVLNGLQHALKAHE